MRYNYDHVKQLNPNRRPVRDENWEPHTHPEGQPYYRNASRKYIYLTEMNLRDPLQLEFTKRFVEELEKEIVIHESMMPEEVEIVLQVEEDAWYYYMVDKRKRCIFWVHQYDATWMADDISGVNTRTHLSMSLLPGE